MARYSLILKDQTYITLAQEALKQGKTLGRFLNDVLNIKAEQIQKGVAGGLPSKSLCIVCGGKATIEAHGKGQQKFFVCSSHFIRVKSVMSGWKEIGDCESPTDEV